MINWTKLSIRTVALLALAAAVLCAGQSLLAQTPKPAPTKPAASPRPTTLPDGWQEIDQRLVFLTIQLSTVESSIDATDKALKQNGYQKIAKEQAAEEARNKNTAMDRRGGGPVPWQEFYGKTAERFFYHPTDGNTVHINPRAIAQRPPQFEYIYRANEDNRQKAADDAARIGTKIDDLLGYRRQLETEQSALWCRIAFRGASSLALSEQPVYRLELTGPAGETGKQWLDACRAGVAFMKSIDAELTAAQKGTDDQAAMFERLHSATATARSEMQAKVLALPTIAAALPDPKSPFGQFVRLTKRLEDSAQNMTDAHRLAADADTQGDLAARNRYRGQIQEMAIDYASSVSAAHQGLASAMGAWKVVPQAKAGETVTVKPGGEASIAGALDAAKALNAQEMTAARRALAAQIDLRLNAAADAGDLATVQRLQSAKVTAITDGSIGDAASDPAVAASKTTMDQAILASRAKLSTAYKNAVSAYTKARKIDEAVAVQGEFQASGLATAASDSGETPALAAGAEPAPAAAPAFEGDTLTVKLAGPAEDVVAGGGGRFLIFHIKKLRQLAIFDVVAAKVTKYINAPADDIAFAASRERLYIAIKETGALQRWNLKTLTQEGSLQGVGSPVNAMVMGYDSAGPLMIVLPKSTLLLNPNAPGRGERALWNPPYEDHPAHVSISGDGRTAVGYDFPGYGAGRTIVLSDNQVISHYAGGYINWNDLLLPPDGGRIYDTMGEGQIYSPDFKSGIKLESLNLPGYAFPSYDSTYFVSYSGAKEQRRIDPKDPVKLQICNASDRRPIATLKDVPELQQSAPMKPFQRVHFMPKFNLLVSVGEGGDEVVLRKLDIYKMLEAQGVDYLVVTSSPPFSVLRGKAMTYQVTVKSLKGNVKYSLDAAPTGMTITPQGLIRWTTPTKLSETKTSVIVKVTDASKQEVFQNFEIVFASPEESAAPNKRK